MAEQSMLAVRIHEFGGPEVLKLEQAPCPVPGVGQVLLRVIAAGVHPADWKVRAGLYKPNGPVPLPWIPGRDGSGIVTAVGEGVTTLEVGQAVYGVFAGSYAEFAAANAADLVPKLERISFEQAAAVPIGALTAWQSLFVTAGLQPRQNILIQGAAGGVGMYAVQLALWKGAGVVGSASHANLDFVHFLGAEQAFDYQAAPVESVVRDMDVVFDTVGGAVTERSLLSLRPGGILVTVAGPVPEEKARQMGLRAARGGRSGAEVLPQISALIEADLVKPVVGEVFPLAEAARAQALSQAGHGRGRMIINIGSPEG